MPDYIGIPPEHPHGRPVARLQRKLDKAVRYEEAARLRDKITELQQQEAAGKLGAGS